MPGVYLSRQFTAPVHVEVGGGWVEIDSTLRPAAGGGFENGPDTVDVSVAAAADDEVVGAVELAGGARVGFSVEDASDAAVAVSGDTATFEGAVPGVDLVLQSVPGGLKETLVLDSAAAPVSFGFGLDLDGLTARLEDDGSVSFVNGSGAPRVTVPPGFMVDAAGASSTGVAYGLDGDRLEVTLDDAWLGDEDRQFPVLVDPSLSLVADADDTYVSEGQGSVDQSSAGVLKAGDDGSVRHRAFVHFDGVDDYAGMDIMAADLALWQHTSGSCTPTPLEVFPVVEEWEGASTQSWPGPDVDDEATAGTVTSGAGHDGSCGPAQVGTDLTRLVRDWAEARRPNEGISLRAGDEDDPDQFKAFTSADGDAEQRPVLNVLWSDPFAESRPEEPSDLAPDGHTDSFTPTFSAGYNDVEGDPGSVLFWGYDAGTGAFMGLTVSDEVDPGETAEVTPEYIPLDYPLEWRALAVDTEHQVGSPLSEAVQLIHPSVRISGPLDGDTVEGIVTTTAELDPSITDADGVTFNLDGDPVHSTETAPYTMTGPTDTVSDGTHTITAQIDGGDHDERLSPPVDINIDNEGGSATPTVVRMLRQVDDITDTEDPDYLAPIDTTVGDCGYSEEMPDGYVLWFFCDVGTNNPPNDSVAGIAPPTDPADPTLSTSRYLGTPNVGHPCDANIYDRAVRWMTGVTSYPAAASTQTIVVIFFRQGCTAELFFADHKDPAWDPGTTGIATAVYDTTSPGTLPSATVHNAALWDGEFAHNDNHWVLHGDGATTDGDHVYAYACLGYDHPGNPPDHDDDGTHGSGRCTLARATVQTSTPANLGIRTNWTYWNGDDWSTCPSTCDDTQLEAALKFQAELNVPAPERPNVSAGIVPQHFQVVYSDNLGVYLAVHQRMLVQRLTKMRIRVSNTPDGPWSNPIDIPVNCDGRARAVVFLNCYQQAAHLGVGTSSEGALAIGYYDRWPHPFDPGNEDHLVTQDEAIRFLRVPLCVKGPPGETSIDWVIDRCFMTDTGWTGSDTMTRLEAAAILWRLGGYRTQTINTSVVAAPRPYREAAYYFLNTPTFDYTDVWDTIGDLVDDEPTERRQLIRLLWERHGAPTAGYPDPSIGDWSGFTSEPLKAALRWAYAEGVVCAATFNPNVDVLRSVAASWVHHSRTGAECTGSI